MKSIKLLLLALILPFAVAAQQADIERIIFTVDNAQSSMLIKGGSTVGSWDADVTVIQAEILVDMYALQSIDGNADGLFSLNGLTIPVKQIQSDGNRMTNNIHKYLNERSHPNITFTLSETSVSPNPGSEGKRFELNANGTINAAGTSKNVDMLLRGELNDNGTITLSGVQHLGFSDFNIDRPSAMLGTVRASEELEIHYTIVLVKK